MAEIVHLYSLEAERIRQEKNRDDLRRFEELGAKLRRELAIKWDVVRGRCRSQDNDL